MMEKANLEDKVYEVHAICEAWESLPCPNLWFLFNGAYMFSQGEKSEELKFLRDIVGMKMEAL